MVDRRKHMHRKFVVAHLSPPVSHHRNSGEQRTRTAYEPTWERRQHGVDVGSTVVLRLEHPDSWNGPRQINLSGRAVATRSHWMIYGFPTLLRAGQLVPLSHSANIYSRFDWFHSACPFIWVLVRRIRGVLFVPWGTPPQPPRPWSIYNARWLEEFACNGRGVEFSPFLLSLSHSRRPFEDD